MADDAEIPPSRTTVGTARMEAFSDGVIAIAITLLVLELAVRPPGSPWEQLRQTWPSLLAYVVSFLTIGAAWIAHNALTDLLDRADVLLLRLNLLFLLFVAFLPFPTKLVADGLYDHGTEAERVAVVVYGLTLLAIRLSFFVLDSYARRAHLLGPDVDDADLRDERRKFLYVVVGYAATIVLGLAAPLVAVALYFALAIFLVIPFRGLSQVFSGRQPDERPQSGSGSGPPAADGH